MIDIAFFKRIFFRVNYLHYHHDVFNVGVNLCSEPQAFSYDGENEERFYLQETGIELWLGLVSFHFGWRGGKKL